MEKYLPMLVMAAKFGLGEAKPYIHGFLQDKPDLKDAFLEFLDELSEMLHTVPLPEVKPPAPMQVPEKNPVE